MGKTALIVDDEMEVRRWVSNLLTTQLGFAKTMDAPSGEAAVDLIKSGENFDLIFSSWEMPRMKGDELLGELRKIPESQNTPFIMMSYKKDKDSLVKAIQAGVNNYLVKPLSAGIFMQKVKKTISDMEKKELDSFKTKRKNPVDIILGDDFSHPASLHSVTKSGCVVRAPLIKGGEVGIYSQVHLAIFMDGIPFRVPSELVALEADRVDSSTRHFIMVTFKFGEHDLKIDGKIDRLINSFSAAVPK